MSVYLPDQALKRDNNTATGRRLMAHALRKMRAEPGGRARAKSTHKAAAARLWQFYFLGVPKA